MSAVEISQHEGLAAISWMRERGWTGGLEVYVPIWPYMGHSQGNFAWVTVTRVSPGGASVYPVKGTCPNGARGQWKPGEIAGFRVNDAGQFHPEFPWPSP